MVVRKVWWRTSRSKYCGKVIEDIERKGGNSWTDD